MSEKGLGLGSIYSCRIESQAVRSRVSIWSAHVTGRTGTLGSKIHWFRFNFINRLCLVSLQRHREEHEPVGKSHVAKNTLTANYSRCGSTGRSTAYGGRSTGLSTASAYIYIFFLFKSRRLRTRIWPINRTRILTSYIWKLTRKSRRTQWRRSHGQIQSYTKFLFYTLLVNRIYLL